MSASSPGARLGRAAAHLVTGKTRLPMAAAAVARPRLAMQRAALRASRHLLGRVGSVLARLGLQVSSVLYLLFALSFGAAGVKGWQADHHRAAAAAYRPASLTAASPLTLLELALALLFLYFSLSSMLRAAARAGRARQ
ncbi:MAG: hypothetical protein ACRD1M_08785 [Terriglobales bacterium]